MQLCHTESKSDVIVSKKSGIQNSKIIDQLHRQWRAVYNNFFNDCSEIDSWTRINEIMFPNHKVELILCQNPKKIKKKALIVPYLENCPYLEYVAVNTSDQCIDFYIISKNRKNSQRILIRNVHGPFNTHEDRLNFLRLTKYLSLDSIQTHSATANIDWH